VRVSDLMRVPSIDDLMRHFAGICSPLHLGSGIVVSLRRHRVHRADRRNKSLEPPHRIINGTMAASERCRQRSQQIHSHGVTRRRSARVATEVVAVREPTKEVGKLDNPKNDTGYGGDVQGRRV
jgi:hypothetical protein